MPSGSGEVRLWWTESSDTVSGVARYLIFHSGDAMPLAETTGTTVTLTGLVAGLRYMFHVRAVDDAGKESPRSAKVFIVVTGGRLPGTGLNFVGLIALVAIGFGAGGFVFTRVGVVRRRRSGLSESQAESLGHTRSSD